MSPKVFELEINGKTVGFRFNMLTLGKATRIEKCTINELFDRLGITNGVEPDLVTLIRFIYCAMENFYEAVGAPVAMEYNAFADSVDIDLITKMVVVMRQSFEGPEEESKKNQEAPKESGR